MAADTGMTSDEAERLATEVRRVHATAVTVEPDGDFFVVQVDSDTGRWTLYDEEDWQAWQSRIVRE